MILLNKLHILVFMMKFEFQLELDEIYYNSADDLTTFVQMSKHYSRVCGTVNVLSESQNVEFCCHRNSFVQQQSHRSMVS